MLNYPKHQYTHGHQCKFLHYTETPCTLNSKKDISNSLNQSVHFQKSVNPQNNTSSNENSKRQNKQIGIQKSCLPTRKSPIHCNRKPIIMRDVVKPETIKEVLESLKIIATAINQIMTATTER